MKFCYYADVRYDCVKSDSISALINYLAYIPSNLDLPSHSPPPSAVLQNEPTFKYDYTTHAKLAVRAIIFFRTAVSRLRGKACRVAFGAGTHQQPVSLPAFSP